MMVCEIRSFACFSSFHVEFGSRLFDIRSQTFGAPIELTRQEFDLLALLAGRPGMVFSRAALLQQVWRGDAYVTERTVDTVVSRLRRKIEIDAQNPKMILTAWGVGYKLADII